MLATRHFVVILLTILLLTLIVVPATATDHEITICHNGHTRTSTYEEFGLLHAQGMAYYGPCSVTVTDAPPECPPYTDRATYFEDGSILCLSGDGDTLIYDLDTNLWTLNPPHITIEQNIGTPSTSMPNTAIHSEVQ